MSAGFYLKSLVIQNFATFKNQKISFMPGFNAIIGETGSGKSLLLDALQLILGGRADKKIVRRETEFSLIEASFQCEDDEVATFLESEGFPLENHEIIIKRLIYKNGATKTYINHLSCTVTFLANFSKKYIDLVGQFENQKLLSEAYQLYLLDHFGKHLSLVSTYQNWLKEYRALLREKEDLIKTQTFRDQRLDYIVFQLQEIEKLNPSSQDEEDLLKKKNSLVNLEKTKKVAYQIRESFEGGEASGGIVGELRIIYHLIAKNQELFPGLMESIAEIDDKVALLRDVLEKKLDQELNEGELEIVLERLDSYQRLKKKFGGTAESILQAQVDFLKEKNQLEALVGDLGGIDARISSLHVKLLDSANILHEKRLKVAANLGSELTQKIRRLKMMGATLKLDLEKIEELTETGITKAYFAAETNPGEGYFRIKDIASGGELSRILLGLRQILSATDSISIFLFDEIDTGIGGETAKCIGKALSEVATHGQVIAITHLPQIAQFAEILIMVNKDIHSENDEARTESTVKEVSGKMILKEVKTMAQLAQ